MMKRMTIFAILIILVASTARSERNLSETVERLMVVSGAKIQVGQYPSLFKAQLDVQKNYIDGRAYKALDEAITKAFGGDVFYRDMTGYLEKNAGQADLEAVLKWYDIPLARKMVDLEVKMSTPEEMQKLGIFAMKLQSEPPSDGRMALIQKLDATLEASKLNKDILTVFFKSFLEGINSLQNEVQKKTADELERQLKQLNAQLDMQVKGQVLVTFLYMYREATDDELKEYIAFYETSHGQQYAKLMSDATIYAFQQFAARYGAALAEIIRRDMK